ncbi:hypothetical protein HC891_10210 [Candidatus Gracilibacteria bacterium]|nr:hypothetical protein [Candidatus Gracilibacteria bacterium]
MLDREWLVVYSDPGGIGRWRRVGHELRGTAVTAIEAEDALTLTVQTATLGVQRSSDGGQSWALVGEVALEPIGVWVATTGGPVDQVYPRIKAATALARLAGKNPVILAAAAGGIMFFRSEDDGIHWEPAGLQGEGIGRVNVIMPASYHIDSAWAGTERGELLHSENRGREWQLVAREEVAILSLAVMRLI